MMMKGIPFEQDLGTFDVLRMAIGAVSAQALDFIIRFCIFWALCRPPSVA